MKTPRLNIHGDPIEPFGLIECACLILGPGTILALTLIVFVRYGLLP